MNASEHVHKQVLLIELNEINFEFVEKYASRGLLPNFSRFIRDHGVSRTRSEEVYEQLEPWIQWVTAHTGKSFAEHRIFRLGDVVKDDIPQVWELIEACGLNVGAISPMNAKNRSSNPAFFVPDPWTATKVVGTPRLVSLYRAIVQAVNDNAEARLTVRSVAALVLGLLTYAQPRNYLQYTRMALQARKRPWLKSMFLDRLLADVFVREVSRCAPTFATLFLNAGAHIQHHYMFCSGAYEGPHRNPEWYVKGADPVYEVFSLYDDIVGNIRAAFPQARLMLATGLHQEPHEQLTYYWRLRDHRRFLRMIGVRFSSVDPRMSRDFLVTCENENDADEAAACLLSVKVDGILLFEVDNRGKDLFVTLSYPKEIVRNAPFFVGRRRYEDLFEHITFVALKNGEHHGTGYFIDSGIQRSSAPAEFQLHEVPSKIFGALNLAGRIGVQVQPPPDGHSV